MRWTRIAATDERSRSRTAKSCGPGAPVLALSCASQVRASDGGKKAGHRGEHEVSRKPLRREGRIASAEPVCSCAFSFVHFAHETAGAARTRSSLRPLVKKACEFDCKPRTHRAARMRTLTPLFEIKSQAYAANSDYPPLEGEGRIKSCEARCDTGWGDGLSSRDLPAWRDHPTPVRIPLRCMQTDPPPPGEGEARCPACHLTKRSPPWSPSSRSAAPECASRSPAETAATGP